VIAAPENGVTEGVHADFGAELRGLPLANHRAIMCNEGPGDRTLFEGLAPSPQHWLVPDIPFMGVEARRDCGSDGPCPHCRQRAKRETL
jgi:hypothetical protein